MPIKKHYQFVEEVINLVANKYSILGDYVNSYTKIEIRHNICNSNFKMQPLNFLSGQRCPICKESHGELKIRDYLNKNNIKFISQKTFEDCKSIRVLPFDFYLSDYNLCIEYDGITHYFDKWNNPTEFEKVKLRDQIKTQYCADNNIKLIRIPYTEFNNIENILGEKLWE